MKSEKPESQSKTKKIPGTKVKDKYETIYEEKIYRLRKIWQKHWEIIITVIAALIVGGVILPKLFR